MNRYELGKRCPDLELIERLAETLGLPAAYFYAVGNDEAELLLKFHQLDGGKRARVIAYVSEELDTQESGIGKRRV
jgi:transcriptional regulator with XRE-family HTH domain